MSNERIDDFLSWRGRLEDPEGIPGQTLDDREAAWERLMDKLRETPRRRFSGYRIAAACLLLALIPAGTIHRAVLITAPPRIARQQPAPAPASASTRPRPAKSALPAKTALPAKAARPAKTTPAAAPSTAPAAPPPAVRLAAAPPETPAPALNAATQTTIKHKEWKVVNIGEINSSFARPHGTAANAPRFGLGDPAAHSDVSPTSQDPPGLKIKLSPQN